MHLEQPPSKRSKTTVSSEAVEANLSLLLTVRGFLSLYAPSKSTYEIVQSQATSSIVSGSSPVPFPMGLLLLPSGKYLRKGDLSTSKDRVRRENDGVNKAARSARLGRARPKRQRDKRRNECLERISEKKMRLKL